MLTLSHLLILTVIILLFAGGPRISRLSRGLGEGVRNFKKGLRGESDIDVTHTIKKIDED